MIELDSLLQTKTNQYEQLQNSSTPQSESSEFSKTRLVQLEQELERLRKNGLDGSEVIFEETMDRLDYFINREYPQTILGDEGHSFQ